MKQLELPDAAAQWAKRLGISPSALAERLAKWPIDVALSVKKAKP